MPTKTAHARTVEGTGLGLPVSRKLVELQGGRLGAESKPGQGSTCWLTNSLVFARLPTSTKAWQSRSNPPCLVEGHSWRDARRFWLNHEETMRRP